MHPKMSARGLEENGGASSLSPNSAPVRELGNSNLGLEVKVSQMEEKEEIKTTFEELSIAVSELNSILRDTPYRIALIRASFVTDDNSNLIQTAECRTQADEEFLGVIWSTPKPYKYGIAVYKKFEV